MTGPVKTGHVGANYTLSHIRWYLSSEKEYLYSVTCIIGPFCVYMSCLHRPSHNYLFSFFARLLINQPLGTVHCHFIFFCHNFGIRNAIFPATRSIAYPNLNSRGNIIILGGGAPDMLS